MSLSTSLPENLPWGEQQAFVLLDGATLSDLPSRIKRLNRAALTLPLYDQPPLAPCAMSRHCWWPSSSRTTP